MTKRRAHGDGSIHRRTRDGRWVGVLDLGYIDGRRSRRTFTATTQAEARQKLKAAQKAAEAGLIATTPMSLRTFLGRWLEEIVDSGTLATKTRVFYRGTCARHIVPALGDVRLDRLSVRDVERFLAAKRESGLGTRSVQAMHATLRRALGVAVRWGLLSRNVASAVQVARPVRDTDRVHAMPRDVVLALVVASRQTRLGAMVSITLMTGLRKGEVLALKWSDVDIDNGTLIVMRSAYRKGGVGMLTKTTKTDRVRTISLPRQAAEILREHKRDQAAMRLAAGPLWRADDFVFTTEVGGLLDEKVPNTILHRVCAKAGLPPERFHNLRHSAAMTAASASHGDLHAVKNLLGHASISTTLDTYGHSMTESQRRLGEVMGDWFDNAPSGLQKAT